MGTFAWLVISRITPEAQSPGAAEARLAGLEVPWREVAHLTVVPVICEEKLRADPEDLPIEADHTAVVGNVRLHHGIDVAQDPVGQVALRSEARVPRVEEGVLLMEIILTTVARNLKLRTSPEFAALCLCLANGLLNAHEVALEIERPVVEIARGNLDVHRHACCAISLWLRSACGWVRVTLVHCCERGEGW